MINLFAEKGPPQHYFKPAWRTHNQLMGVEVITCFAEKHSLDSLSPETTVTSLEDKQQIAIFNEKIALIEKLKHLLAPCEITVWVSINDIILTEIMQNPDWIVRIQQLPFLTLMIEESFPGISYGRNNLRLIWLTEKFPLALANLGSGSGSTRAVFDGLFRHVFLDKCFIHNQSQRISFTPFANAIIRQIAPFCEALMVSGIDNMALYNEVKKLEFAAMCGNLWPVIAPDNLASVLSVSKSSPR